MTSEEIQEIATQVAAIMASKTPTNPLSDDERTWVRMAIKKEAQTIAFRQAVIEKTTGGLILVMFSAIGYLMLDWAKRKGFQP